MTRYNSTNFPLCLAALFSFALVLGAALHAAGQNGDVGTVKLTKCAEFRVEGPVAHAIAADTQKVYIGTLDGSVQALDSNISSSIWRTELGGEIVSNIAAADTGVLAISNPVKMAESVPTESVIRSLSKETGVPNWTARLPYSEIFYLGVIQGSIVSVNRDGLIIALDAHNGSVIWRTLPLGTVAARPMFTTHGIAFGTAEKQIFIVSAATGETMFRSSTEFIPTAVTHPSHEGLVVGDERGNVASISVPGGKTIWKFKGGAGISFVSVSKDGLIVTSLDNFIYSIWMYNGDVIWKRRLPGRVTEGVSIVEGFVTALIYGENSAFLIDSKKGKIVDQLPQSDRNFVNQVPVVANESNLLVTTPDAVMVYGLKGCEQKIGKAASNTPPLTKQ